MGNVIRETNHDQVSQTQDSSFPFPSVTNPTGSVFLTWSSRLDAHVRYGISDIRTLVGHKTDLAQVKIRPAVRLEKGD